jgi:hypothetical protein
MVFIGFFLSDFLMFLSLLMMCSFLIVIEVRDLHGINIRYFIPDNLLNHPTNLNNTPIKREAGHPLAKMTRPANVAGHIYYKHERRCWKCYFNLVCRC